MLPASGRRVAFGVPRRYHSGHVTHMHIRQCSRRWHWCRLSSEDCFIASASLRYFVHGGGSWQIGRGLVVQRRRPASDFWHISTGCVGRVGSAMQYTSVAG